MAANQSQRRPQSRFVPDRIVATTVEEPTTLLEFLLARFPERKRTGVKNLLAHNQVAIGDAPTRQFDTQLHPGDVVRVNFTREFRVFYHRRLQLVYEDDDLIVVNKGYGLLSVGTDKPGEVTAYSILREYLKWKDPRNKIFVVHRLDRDTSGLMLFAKNIETKERLQHNWNNMVLSRRYLAVVEGSVEPDADTVRSYLAENSRFEVYSTQNPHEGQLAVTRYSTIAAGRNYTMLAVELDTGRKNQIRVHMRDIGHPIAGDRKYGAGASPIHRLALHAQTLRFVHPTSRREMNFSTPVPQSFKKLVDRF